MRQIFQEQLEQGLDQIVRNAMRDNPMKNTPLEGMHIYSAIATASEQFKSDDFKQGARSFGLGSSEIDLIVDQVIEKTMKKYLEF
ncbi:hypothetical protein [Flaviaesturariibacter terrae]